MQGEIQNDSIAENSAAGKITADETQGSLGVDKAVCRRKIRSITARFDHAPDRYPLTTLTVNGMHCGACVSRVEKALEALDGVADAVADIAARKATVRYDPVVVDLEGLKAAVTSAGYEIGGTDPGGLKPAQDCCEQPVDFANPRAYLLGVLASFVIVGIYLGMNTLTSNWHFARVQFSEYRWWIISLASGLGIQVMLYILFRAHLRGKKKSAAKSTMAASGGVSALAMMACCSHYLATLIPLLGVSFLSAAAVASLAQYQPYFFLAGMASCLFGITLMVRMMRKHGMFKTGVPKMLMRIRPGRLGKI